MGPVRHLRKLAPLALVATLAAVLLSACGGSDSSSNGASGPTPSSQALQLRPVYARYAVGVPLGGQQLGPSVPQSLVDTMKNFDCSSGTQDVQGMLMVCDAAGTVFLLKDPFLTGGVATAEAQPIRGEKEWFVEVGFDPQATTTLSNAVDTQAGTEVALVVDNKVISAPIIDDSMKD